MEKLYQSGYLSHHQQAYSLRRVTIDERARGTQIVRLQPPADYRWTSCRRKVRWRGTASLHQENGYDSLPPWR